MRAKLSWIPCCLLAATFAAPALAADKKAPKTEKAAATSAKGAFDANPPTSAPAGWVDAVKVQPDKAPDNTSLKLIVESVTRGCKTNDEKAIALYNYCQLTHYHRNYPNEQGGIPVLKEINCYGWSLCGGLHSVESALWREAGFGWRFVGWNGHTTVEAQYDGKWHYLDVFLKFYAWEPDGKGGRTIASQDDLNKNSDKLVKDAFVLDPKRNVVYAKDDQVAAGGKVNWQAPQFLSCGDTIEGVISGLKTHHAGGPDQGWMGIQHATGNYSTDVKLAPGLSLTNTWDAEANGFYWNGGAAAPRHTCPNYKDTRNDPGYGLILEPYMTDKPARSYADGKVEFAPDFSNDGFLKSFVAIENAKYENKSLVPAAGKTASVVVDLSNPYIFAKGTGEAAGADSVEVSTDGGKTYNKADLKDFSEALKVKGTGNTQALVKVLFKEPLTSLKLEAVVQNNPGSLAYLSPGKNTVTVSVADPAALGDNKLVVTYAYRLGSQAKSFEELATAGKQLANGTASSVKWADEVTYVQKSFGARDLPAKFEIDIPTPKGQHPAYPRMVSLRREVIAPKSAPAAMPKGYVAAGKLGPNDELQTLPNPFLIGTEPATMKTTQN